MLRRIKFKHAWWAFLGLWGVASYFDMHLPKDWETTRSWLLTFDEWTINHTAYPGLFLLFVVLLIGTVIAPEGVRIVGRYLAHKREQELATNHAEMTMGYRWDDEAAPERADFQFKIFAENYGSVNADIGEVFAEFRRPGNDSTLFVGATPRLMNTVFRPGQGRDVFSMQLPDGDEGLRFYGFLRWKDKAGEWEHLFCMEPRAHPGPNEHHFTQVGDTPWNDVRRIG